MKENATLIHLAESESLSSYCKKRYAMSYEEGPTKKQKSHSPTQNQTWDKEAAIALLKAHPPQKKINWSAAAKTIGIQNGNAGQVLKAFANSEGFDTTALECRTSPPPPRIRRSKKKLPGGEISTPALPTPQSIVDEKKQLIASGQLSIGEPCSPYVITKHVVTKEGDVVNKTVELHGRKIPLLELRQRLLTRQEKFMRLMTDNDIQKLSREQIIDQMERTQHTRSRQTTGSTTA